MNYVASIYARCMYFVNLKIVISYKNQIKIAIKIKAL